MKTTKPQTAAEAFETKRAALLAELDALRAHVAGLAPVTDGSWGHAGDMGYALEKATEIASFLGVSK